MKAERQMNMANDKVTLLVVDEVDRGQPHSNDRNDERKRGWRRTARNISFISHLQENGWLSWPLIWKVDCVVGAITHRGLLALGNRNAAMEFRIGGSA